MAKTESQILNVSEFLSCKGLKMVHLNVRSLLPKIDVIRNDLLCDDIDILTLSETWLHPSIPSGLLAASNYTLHRLDRLGDEQGQKTKGGGVCAYIRKNLNFRLLEELNYSDKHKELQFVVVSSNNAKSCYL